MPPTEIIVGDESEDPDWDPEWEWIGPDGLTDSQREQQEGINSGTD
jgi:hypothetical protein